MKIKNIALSAIIALSSTSVFAADCNSFSERQKDRIQFGYDYGKQHDWGLTMAAIAVRESSAGVNKVNFSSNDFGLFQNNVKTATSRRGISMNSVEALELIYTIVRDDELSAELALEELRYWSEDRNRSYAETLASYNAGNLGLRSSSGRAYYEDVADLVRMLQRCNWLVR